MNTSNEDRENVILQGDCLEIMRTLPNEYVDLVVTSPPYNLRGVSGGITSNGQSLWKSNPLKNGYDSYNDNMPHAEIFQVLTHYELSIDFFFPAVLKASDVFPSCENSKQLKEDC